MTLLNVRSGSKADMMALIGDVRFVPQADNHLVGAGDERRRHGKAEHLGGLEVDDQIQFGRLFYRKVGGLLTFEDTIDVTGAVPELVHDIDSQRGLPLRGLRQDALERRPGDKVVIDFRL